MPLISVIIPVYNGAKTIKETIESVLKQTLTDFELIVINSDSTDGTLEIVNSIEDPRLKVFTYSQANVAVNRNHGVTHAAAEYLTFLDADDLWTPDKLEAQYKALLENPQADVAYSWTDAIDENGKYLRPCSHVSWTGDVYSQLLLDDFIGSGSNVMLSRQPFNEVGGFDGSLTNAQDIDLWLKLAARYNFVAVKKVQIFYRISSQSMSSNILGLEASNLKVIERAFSTAPSSLQYLKSYTIANLYKYLSYKALAVPPGQQKTLQAVRLLWKSIITDPSLVKKPVIYKAGLKLAVMTLLPTQWATALLNKFPRLSNTSTFFGYIKAKLP